MTNTFALVAGKLALGSSLALGLMLSPHTHAVAYADSCTQTDAYAREVGDDNCDGIIMEDESGWDCATMGNLICGPNVVRHENVQLATGPNAWDNGEYVGGYN